MTKTLEEKYQTVLGKNTFYFFDADFEENYEGHIISLKDTLLNVKNRIEIEGLRKEIFIELISKRENGLKALLALSGFSNEYLKRLTTIIRIVDNPELSNLVYKDKWFDENDLTSINEWSDSKILLLIKNNKYFRKGIVNLFFEGSSISFLRNTIPLFELKKLSLSKLCFDVPELIDTLVRYKEKGSYSGRSGNNPETLIRRILDKRNITYESGDLTELIDNAPDNKRTMDFLIPNKENPLIIAECSFLATTSSGQGDKAKTELSIDALINKHYPNASFIGFVDGIGWYVRKEDLKRMITAYEDVYTFHSDELRRFESLLGEIFKDV